MLVTAMPLPAAPEPPIDSTAPAVTITLGKAAYRPGDTLSAIIDIDNWTATGSPPTLAPADRGTSSVIIESCTVNIKGVEKLDPSWVQRPKFLLGEVHPSGERIILEAAPIIISKDATIENGGSRTYSIRVKLPPVLPPSYRGTAVRYHYFVSARATWRSGGGAAETTPTPPSHPVDTRVSFRIWTLPESSGLTSEELGAEDHYGPGGIVPLEPVIMTARWHKRHTHSRGVASEEASGAEEEEPRHPSAPVERVVSYPLLSLPPTATATEGNGSVKEGDGQLADFLGGSRSRLTSTPKIEHPSPHGGLHAGGKRDGAGEGDGEGEEEEEEERRLRGGASIDSEGEESEILSDSGEGEKGFDPFGVGEGRGGGGGTPARKSIELDREPASPSAAFVYMRSRTYNIRMEDHILVKFTPRNPTPTYFLGDVVSGTLTFPHDQGGRKCLAVSVFLETHEVVNPIVIHPSRKQAGAPLHLPQIQTECHEVTTNLLATHFIFTIPMDAPSAFATPLVSVQWILRFEFLASRRKRGGGGGGGEGGADEEAERGEWSMPIVVHAPLPRSRPLGVSGQVSTHPPKELSPSPPRQARTMRKAASNKGSFLATSNGADRRIERAGDKVPFGKAVREEKGAENGGQWSN